MEVLGGGARWRCLVEVLAGGARWACSVEVLSGRVQWRCSVGVFSGGVQWACSVEVPTFSSAREPSRLNTAYLFFSFFPSSFEAGKIMAL